MAVPASNVTPEDLFLRVRNMMDSAKVPSGVVNKMMHETLVLVCAEALRESHHGFGDLNAQVETLIRRLHIPSDEANAVRRMRRHSNRSEPILPEDLRYDLQSLASLIGRVYATKVPADLTAALPHNRRQPEEKLHTNSPDKRCIVCSWDERTIRVIIDEEGYDGEVTVCYAEATQYARMEYLAGILHVGMHLNLLDCEERESLLVPRLIIVEPDCLLDISTIAGCFEDYGHHPLLYLVSRMRSKANTPATLLGSFAGRALDDIIHAEAGTSGGAKASVGRSLTNSFREKAMEYSTCDAFDAEQFKRDAAAQATNLQQIVGDLRQNFDLGRAVLEPSFICEKLGLQGRVDLMTTDLKLLVEQKSGRNIFLERNVPNPHGTKVVEKHYVQLLLYYGVLYYNFHQSHTDIRLLYSKYPLPGGMMSVASLMKLVYEAIRFRNEAIAMEFQISREGLDKVLPELTADKLNTARRRDFFYETYLRPQLDAVVGPLQKMQPLERAYFCRMMQFAIRENLLGKVGVVEGTGSSMANLWNMPMAEKRETGNIYTGLTIINKEKSCGADGDGGYDLITLAVPGQGDDFLPNFRRGDMVCLYAYPADAEPDVRQAMVFKGGLADIRTDRLTVKLADGQQNAAIFDRLPYGGRQLSTDPAARPEQRMAWCVEHGSSDVGGSAAIRSLYEFVTAPADRKALLLGQRAPRIDRSLTLSRSYDPQLDPLLLRARQSRDYFLLVGPPGTGKTSRALRFMVEEQLASEQGSILLLSYTNRAVDEICGMLVEAGIDFLRIGSELSCAKAYEPYLVSNAIGNHPRLDTMRQLLLEARVVVATTSMLQARPFLFSLKCFELAVVDESSQILEPGIIGLLATHRPAAQPEEGEACAIGRFILIGDYKQLPAVVQQNDRDAAISDPALRAIGLADCKTSLFERLIRLERAAGRTDFVGTLHHQGRMHPEVAAFAVDEFYHAERLLPVPLRHQLEQSLGYDAPSEDATDDLLKHHRLLFFATAVSPRPDLSDKVNAAEASLVADLLRRIRRFYGSRFEADKTVGVIVPYRNQIAMIRREMARLGLDDMEEVSIDTVERYQGSQRDVIIYSFTVQQRYQLNFLTANTFEEDGRLIDRKLNVALTRARRQLILTGHPDTLAASPVFAKLMRHIEAGGGRMIRG